MKVIDTRQPFLAGISRDAHAAAGDTLKEARGRQARRTGKLAAGMELVERPSRNGIRLAITNHVVYADAVERGANARVKASVKAGTKRSRSKKKGDMQGPLRNRATRRGPHMAGNHVVLQTGPRFLDHMTARLRQSS